MNKLFQKLLEIGIANYQQDWIHVQHCYKPTYSLVGILDNFEEVATTFIGPFLDQKLTFLI
jgi:hypothetical protein